MDKIKKSSEFEMTHDRKGLSLDFNSSRKVRMVDLRDGILSSPDVGLLKLTTPEIERFLVPLSAIPTPVFYPSTGITEADQEAYTQGFVDALLELQRQQVSRVWSGGIPSLVTLTPVSPFCAPLNSDLFEGSTQLPINLTTTDRVSSESQQKSPTISERHALLFKSALSSSSSNWSSSDIANIVSASSATRNTPPQSPVDKTDRELARLARRREKNRDAARKCRTKKLERISQLEERVQELKDQNSQLACTLEEHKQNVYRLKQKIAEHVEEDSCRLVGNISKKN
jgi:hypothetical protein